MSDATASVPEDRAESQRWEAMKGALLPEILLSTFVPGRPRSKGSLKHWCMKDRRHTVRVEEQVADSARWKRTVAAHVQREALKAYGRHVQYAGPVELRVVFYFDRDREDRPEEDFPVAMSIGDLDKLLRNVGDALVSSGLIKDDQYIVSVQCEKRWAALTDGSRQAAGAGIRVRKVVSQP